MSINEDLEEIEYFIENIEGKKLSEVQQLLIVFFKNHKKMNRVEQFIGDFPTFCLDCDRFYGHRRKSHPIVHSERAKISFQ